MGMQPPDYGPTWNAVRDAVIFLGTGGSNWPEADEDQIQALHDAFSTFTGGLAAGISATRAAAADVTTLWSGDSGHTFADTWNTFGIDVPQQLFDIITGPGGVLDSLNQARLDVEYDKISTTIEVSVLILEMFVWAIALLIGFWVAFAAAAARIGATRLTVTALMHELVAAAGSSFARQGLSGGIRAALRSWAGHLPRNIANEMAAELGIDGTTQILTGDLRLDRLAAAGLGGAAGAVLSVGTPIGRDLANRTNNRLARQAGRIGTDAADEIITELGAETLANGTVYGQWQINTNNLAARTAAGMARDHVSHGADLTNRIETTLRNTLNPTPAIQGLAGAARTSAGQATAAAAQARQAAAQAVRASGGTPSGATASRPAAGGVTGAGGRADSGTSGRAQPTTTATAGQNGGRTAAPTVPGGRTVTGENGDAAATAQAQRSAQAATRAAAVAEAAARQAQEAAVRADQAGTVAAAREAARQAAAATTEALRQAAAAMAHANPGSLVTTDPGGLPTAAPQGTAPAAGTPATNPVAPAPATDPITATSPADPASAAAAPTIAPATALTGPPTLAPRTTGPTVAPTTAPATTSPTSVSAAAAATAAQTQTPPPPQTPQTHTLPQAQTQQPPQAAQTQTAPQAQPAPRTQTPPTQTPPTQTAPTASGVPKAAAPSPTPGAHTAPAATPATTTSPQQTAAPSGVTHARAHPGDAALARAHPGHTTSAVPDRATPLGVQRNGPRATRLGGGVPASAARASTLDPASPADQRRLDAAVPRDPDGRPALHPDPRGLWVSLLNDGGPGVGGRASNCADAVHALLSTWFGTPLVAGMRREGRSSPGEETEAWLGGRFQSRPDGAAGLTRVAADLRRAGHGAATAVAVRFAGEPVAHLLAAVNHNGTVYWIDPQNWTSARTEPPYAASVVATQALPLTADGSPLPQTDLPVARALQFAGLPSGQSPVDTARTLLTGMLPELFGGSARPGVVGSRMLLEIGGVRHEVQIAAVPGDDVRLDRDPVSGHPRLLIGDDVAGEAVLRAALARQVGRIHLGTVPADPADAQAALIGVLSAYAHAGVQDVLHALAVNRPGTPSGDPDAAAALAMAEPERARDRRIDAVLTAALTARPDLAADLAFLFATAAQQLGQDGSPALVALLGRIENTPRPADLATAAVRSVAARVRSVLSTPDADPDAVFSDAVAQTEYALRRALATPDVVDGNDDFTAAAFDGRADLLTAIGDDTGPITLPPTRRRGDRLDGVLHRAIRQAAGRLRFASADREAAALAALPATARAALRRELRRTVETPDRVTVRHLPDGSSEFTFQRDHRAVTVRVERGPGGLSAYVADVGLTTTPPPGGPAAGVVPDRIRVRSHASTGTRRRRVWTPAALRSAVDAAAALFGATATGTGVVDLTWPAGRSGPARVAVSLGRTRATTADVRPPARPGDPWRLRIDPRALTDDTSLHLAVAEALAVAVATSRDQAAGLTFEPAPAAADLTGARLHPVWTGTLARLTRLADPRTPVSTAEAMALVEEFGLRADVAGNDARRRALDTRLRAIFGDTTADHVRDLIEAHGVAPADLATDADRAALDRLRERRARLAAADEERNLTADILLGQAVTDVATTIGTLAGLAGTGPPLSTDQLAATLQDAAASLGATVQASADRDGVTADLDGHRITVTLAALPAGQAVHLRLSTNDIQLVLSDGLPADLAALHLVGALAEARETLARIAADRPLHPADLLGDHPLPRSRRADVDGLGPRDVRWASQIQWLAQRLTSTDRQAAVNLMVLLQAAGVRSGPHAQLRLELLESLLTPQVRDAVRLLAGPLPATLADQLTAALDGVTAPAPRVSAGRATMPLRLPTLQLEANSSLSVPAHRPLRPWVRRAARSRADRLERWVTMQRFRVERLGARRGRVARTAMWAPRFVLRRPLAFLTTPLRFQRPWRISAAATRWRAGWVTLPDGRRRAVVFGRQTASTTLNQLGGLRASTFTAISNRSSPSVLFPQTGWHFLDALANLINEVLPFVTVSVGDANGIGTPLPMANKETQERAVTVRALVAGGGRLRAMRARSAVPETIQRRHGFTAVGFIGTFLSVEILGVKGFYIWTGGQFGAVGVAGDLTALERRLREIRADFDRLTADGRRIRALLGLRRALLAWFRELDTVSAELQPLVIELGYSHRRLPFASDPFQQSSDPYGIQTNPNVNVNLGDVHPLRALRTGARRTRSFVIRSLHPDLGAALGVRDARPALTQAAPPGRPGADAADAAAALLPALRLPDVAHYRRIRAAQAAGTATRDDERRLRRILTKAERSPRLRAALEVADWLARP